ncbi:MAG: hypothetical protein MMC33_004205 [Icmadophila ericetorum]|nr:hypothetical protein [Icmadophila ericetorum]
MQSKVFVGAVLSSAISLISAQGVSLTTGTPQEILSGIAAVSTYITGLEGQGAFASVGSVFATALPSAAISSFENDPIDFLIDFITNPATPTWYSALPTDVQNFVQSVESVGVSLFEAQETPVSTAAGSTTAGGSAPSGTVVSGSAASAGTTTATPSATAGTISTTIKSSTTTTAAAVATVSKAAAPPNLIGGVQQMILGGAVAAGAVGLAML